MDAQRLVPLAFAAAVLSCSSPKETPAPAQDVIPAQTATATAPSAAVQAPAPTTSAAVPQASVLRVLGRIGATHYFPVGRALVACGTCYLTPPKIAGLAEVPEYVPDLWLVTADKVERDATLWPGKAYFPKTLADLVAGDVGTLVFFGRHPNELWARVDYSNDRTGGSSEAVRRSGKIWVKGTPGPDVPRYDSDSPHRMQAPPPPPRAYDDALVHAPWPDADDRLAFGAGAPPLLPGPKQLGTWKEGKWALGDAPWSGDAIAHRLSSGETLVVSAAGVFLVDEAAAVRTLSLPGAASKETFQLFRLEESFVILRPDGQETEVLAPVDPAALHLAKRPERERSPERPAGGSTPAGTGSASAAPADSGAPAAGASGAPSPVEMPAAVSFTASCKAPFVVLSTPPRLGWQHEPVRRALLGHTELQDALSFVSFRRGAVVYFGAQATTEEAARKLVEIVEQAKVGLKPQLACLDAVSHIPDRYDPPEGMERVLLNLTTGERLVLSHGWMEKLPEKN